MKEAVRRQQEVNELCRRNTAQAQMRQRKKYNEKILQAIPYALGSWYAPKGPEKLLKKWRAQFMKTEVHQQGRFYRLSHRACGALRKSETSRPISERLVCITDHGRTRVSNGRASK